MLKNFFEKNKLSLAPVIDEFYWKQIAITCQVNAIIQWKFSMNATTNYFIWIAAAVCYLCINCS